MANVKRPVFKYEIQEKCTANVHTGEIVSKLFRAIVCRKKLIFDDWSYLSDDGFAIELRNQSSSFGWNFYSLSEAKISLEKFIMRQRDYFQRKSHDTKTVVDKGVIEI